MLLTASTGLSGQYGVWNACSERQTAMHEPLIQPGGSGRGADVSNSNFNVVTTSNSQTLKHTVFGSAGL